MSVLFNKKKSLAVVLERPGAEEMEEILYLRWLVLREPLGMPRGSERDALDEKAVHGVIRARPEDVKPLAVARLHREEPDEGRIRYMAVLPSLQGQGLGRMLIEALQQYADSRGIKVLRLNARQEAVPFYTRCGYRVEEAIGELLPGIPHFRMGRTLGEFAGRES